MVNKPVGIAAVLIVGLGMMLLGDRLGLLRPDGRGLQTCLFFTVFGVVLVITVAVLQLGPRVFVADTPVLVAFVLVGALAGVISGLLLSYINRRWPS